MAWWRNRLAKASGRSRAARFSALLAIAGGLTSACRADDRTAVPVPDIPVWTLAEQSDFQSAGGELDGDSIFFYDIAGAVFDGDGIVVAVRGGDDNRLIFLDGSGVIVRTVGRTGDGPGEFGRISGLYNTADGIAVRDSRNRRLSFFSDSGTPRRAIALRSTDPIIGVLESGHYVTSPSNLGAIAGTIREFHIRDDAGEVTLAASGPRVQPGSGIRLRVNRPSGSSFYLNTSMPSGCSADILSTVLHGRLYVVDNEQGSVLNMRPDGSMEPRYRPAERALVSEELIVRLTSFMESWAERVARPDAINPMGILEPGPQVPREALDSIVSLLGRPGDPMPAIWRSLVADRAGYLWLRRAECLSETDTAVWEVIDTTGTHVANAMLPSDLRIWSIDGDRLLTEVTDSMGIEHIAVFRVHR